MTSGAKMEIWRYCTETITPIFVNFSIDWSHDHFNVIKSQKIQVPGINWEIAFFQGAGSLKFLQNFKNYLQL